MNKVYSAIATVLLAAVSIAACEQEGGAERTGENIDDAMEKTGDAMEDAADEAGDRFEDATDRARE